MQALPPDARELSPGDFTSLLRFFWLELRLKTDCRPSRPANQGLLAVRFWSMTGFLKDVVKNVQLSPSLGIANFGLGWLCDDWRRMIVVA